MAAQLGVLEDLGVVLGQPGQPHPLVAEQGIGALQGLGLGAGELPGGAQVVDGQLGQRQPQQAGLAGPGAGRVHPQPLLGPGVVGQAAPAGRPALQVLAVGVEQQHGVAAPGGQELAGQDLHQVALAHAGGGEHADVAGQGLAPDADRQVDGVLARAQPPHLDVAHPLAQEGQVGVGGGGHGGELGGQALGLVEALGVDVAKGDDLGHLVQPLLEVAQGGGLADGVHGHQPAGGALGPAGVRGLRAVGDVGDPEQVAPAPLRVVPGQQLAQEQVLAVEGPEAHVEHGPSEDASLVVGHGRDVPRGRAQAFRVRWKSRITRSTSSSDSPSRRNASRRSRRRSARSGPGSDTTRWTAASG